MDKIEFNHRPIMLNEIIENLKIRPDGIYVDATIGGAGHSLEIVKRLSKRGLLVGIDQDEAAVCTATERLHNFRDRVKIVRSNYSNFIEILNDININEVDGILLDLGVSSHQLDTADRGFSYMNDAPLDMRMDRRNTKTAKDIVNLYDFDNLKRIISQYGEDRFASSIAREILKEREKKEIETTLELVETIKRAIPLKYRCEGGHPAKRTFQAIRIELNRELEVLKDTIDKMIEKLSKEGRIAIITFHSLEDRIVKNTFKKMENPCICPPNLPICACGKKSFGKMITKKPILPSKEELETNPRARSAKLRVFARMR